MTTPIVTKNSLPGETPGAKLVRLLKSYAGCSLNDRRDELGQLVARGVDVPEQVVTVATNCGTSALGIMALAGVPDPLLDHKYVSGMAIAWLRQIGINKGALVKYTGKNGPQPKLGSLLRYNTAGKNDDHVEWMTSDIDSNGHAEHGGGGRDHNAITVSPSSDVTSSWGRPLVEFWDPDMLGIEVVPAGSDINQAYPDA